MGDWINTYARFHAMNQGIEYGGSVIVGLHHAHEIGRSAAQQEAHERELAEAVSRRLTTHQYRAMMIGMAECWDALSSPIPTAPRGESGHPMNEGSA